MPETANTAIVLVSQSVSENPLPQSAERIYVEPGRADKAYIYANTWSF